jgi:hypothetical protein
MARQRYDVGNRQRADRYDDTIRRHARGDQLLQSCRPIRHREFGAFAGGAEQRHAVTAVLHQLAAALDQQSDIGSE